MIEFQPKTQEWKLSLYKNPNAYAICNETQDNYPFGTYIWYFFNDTCPRATERDLVAQNVHKFSLSLSACTKDEFNCRDGTW